VLQPLRWCCVDCVIHHERVVREEQKCTCVAQASNNKKDCEAWSLLLLAAAVRSFAHMPLGISDRNKMVLWPGCGGRTEFSLHTKNVRSVWFVLKRRGCCCNLSRSVALIVWFTTYGMYVKKTPLYMWREQAIVREIASMISIAACCHGAKLCAHAARDFLSQHTNFYAFKCL